MFKKNRGEEFQDPKEVEIYRKNKAVETYEPKKTLKKNLTVFLGLLFVLIVVGTTLYEVQEAEASELIFKPGEQESIMTKTENSVEQNTGESETASQQEKLGSNNLLWQGFHPEVLRWERKIMIWADAYDMDPNLIATLMQIESCGWQYAESGAGALGLFQVMPDHFKDLSEAFKPGVNARTGLDYFIRGYKKASGNLKLAFAMYNGGHNINPNPNTWFDETKRHSKWGTGIMNDIASGAEKSQTLQRWYANGGNGLCKQAVEGNN